MSTHESTLRSTHHDPWSVRPPSINMALARERTRLRVVASLLAWQGTEPPDDDDVVIDHLPRHR
jgi:hypothetical protein